jgi:hypothetical protein
MMTDLVGECNASLPGSGVADLEDVRVGGARTRAAMRVGQPEVERWVLTDRYATTPARGGFVNGYARCRR